MVGKSASGVDTGYVFGDFRPVSGPIGRRNDVLWLTSVEIATGRQRGDGTTYDAGIPREAWLEQDLWRQWRATLQGRRVFVSDGGGLAVTVTREPGAPRQKLPAMIVLQEEHLVDAPYTSRRGWMCSGARWWRSTSRTRTGRC